MPITMEELIVTSIGIELDAGFYTEVGQTLERSGYDIDDPDLTAVVERLLGERGLGDVVDDVIAALRGWVEQLRGSESEEAPEVESESYSEDTSLQPDAEQ